MPKNATIPVRVEEGAKKAFERYCKENYTTPSAMIYKFIHQTISGQKKIKTRTRRIM